MMCNHDCENGSVEVDRTNAGAMPRVETAAGSTAAENLSSSNSMESDWPTIASCSDSKRWENNWIVPRRAREIVVVSPRSYTSTEASVYSERK